MSIKWKLNKGFFFYWLPVLVYAGAIFYMSHQSDPETVIKVEGADKVLHALEFMLLCLLLIRANFFSYRTITKTRSLFIAAFLSTFYAVSDEVHQMFIPMRDASILDFYADISGIILAVLLIFFGVNRKLIK